MVALYDLSLSPSLCVGPCYRTVVVASCYITALSFSVTQVDFDIIIINAKGKIHILDCGRKRDVF